MKAKYKIERNKYGHCVVSELNFLGRWSKLAQCDNMEKAIKVLQNVTADTKYFDETGKEINDG